MPRRWTVILDAFLAIAFCIAFFALVTWLALCIGVGIGEHYRW